MTLYTLNGGSPAALPARFVDGNGDVFFGLDERDAVQLAGWGFEAAPEQPPFDPATQVVEWQDGAWVAIDLPPPPPPSADAVNAERDRRIDGNMLFAGVAYQMREQDRENIAGAATLAGFAMFGGAGAGNLLWHGGEQPFGWIAADNSITPMDAPTVFAFGKAVAAWKSAHIFAARALKDMEPIPADFAADAYWPQP